jgi:signal transduction histidine kinase
VERLSRWHGVPRWWLTSLSEDPDGTVWVVGLAGVARVPASARESGPPPLVVRPTRLTVGGREQPLDRPARAVSGRDTVEVRWAAPSFRDPARLRYRFRLDPSQPWVETETPRLILAAPQAGRYAVETAAALDAERWSTSPAAVDLQVVLPWYRSGWFLAALAATALAVAVVAYRLRVAQLLRLERQRTEIAMDLHDDLGSTLGGVGLLASLAEDESLQPDERRHLLQRIARQTGSASSALSDIVWSLRPGAETLDQLVLALRERAAELCPNGGVAVRVETPDPCPRERLTLAVRRNLQWIAVEALRNAVRHGDPRHITLRLEPLGMSWHLLVEDDGRGLAPAADGPVRGGLGLANMRRRAGAVRARLEVGPASHGGTRVSVVFRADGRRPPTII